MPIKRATGRYKGTKFYRVGKGVGFAHSSAGILGRAKPWEREGAILLSRFRRSEGKGIAVEAVNSKRYWNLRRRLYQKAKQELRKSLEEDDRKPVFGKTERTV